MADVYKLPVSSYDELIKIIKTYGNGKAGVPVSLDDLVKSSGMSKTIISKNNGFLIQIGLITEGMKKTPTELCRRLAKSYSMNLPEQTDALWRSIFEKDEFISQMISVIGVRTKISKTEFVNHIVYSAECGNGAGYKAGAAAIIEIMKRINMISEIDGDIVLSDLPGSTHIVDAISTENVEITSPALRTTQAANDIEPKAEQTFYVQQYTCESGQIAKIMIPENATEDDLLGFRDMLNIALKRKFKLKIDD